MITKSPIVHLFNQSRHRRTCIVMHSNITNQPTARNIVCHICRLKAILIKLNVRTTATELNLLRLSQDTQHIRYHRLYTGNLTKI